MLDLVLTTDHMLVSSVNVEPPFSTSDHNSVEFDINIFPESPPEPKKWPNFSRGQYGPMDAYFHSLDWQNLLANTDVHEKFDTIGRMVDTAVSKFVPMCSSKIFACPVPPDTKRAYFKKKRCYRKVKSKPRPSAEKVADFKQASKLLRSLSRRDTFQEENKILGAANNKAFFKFLRKKLTSRDRIPTLNSKSGTKCTKSDTKAEACNEQFVSAFVEDDGILPPFAARTDAKFDTIEISEQRVLKMLKKLPNKLSLGPDQIPPRLLKMCASSLARPLTLLFQQSLDEGVLPAQWLMATVVPIFKRKGKSCEPANYRPVSLTAACCRLFESLLKEPMVEFLETNGLISNAQHGFRSKKSTLTNTLEGMLEWFEALKAGDIVHSIFLDFAKAFDTVSHPKLLHKLVSYGISGKVLAWIKAFLSGRTQRVRVDDALSSEVPVTSGVPQGSVLGPILFLIYVNDIVDVTAGAACSLFADDAKVSVRCDKHTATDPALLQALTKIQEWSKTWQLSLSLPKCQIFCFGAAVSQPHYEIDGVALEVTADIKDLGVFLSSSAKSSYQCAEVAKKGLAKVAHIFRCFRTRNRKFLLDMFRVYVRPIVEYNTPVWSPYLLKDIKAIERVQRSFTKRFPGLRDLSYKQRLDTLGLKSLEEMRLRSDLVLTFRMLKNKVNLNFSDFFSLSPETRTRGHSLKLFRPSSHLDVVNHSFSYRVPPVWNSLPAEVIECTSVEMFKQKLAAVNLESFLRGQDI